MFGTPEMYAEIFAERNKYILLLRKLAEVEAVRLNSVRRNEI